MGPATSANQSSRAMYWTHRGCLSQFLPVKPASLFWEPPSTKTFNIQNFTTNKDKQIQLDALLDNVPAYIIYDVQKCDHKLFA